MAQIFKNNTWGTLASQLTAGATTATLSAGHGFTDPGTDWYLATLIGVTGTTETAWEIVKVTDVSTNTLTIVRAQEGTTDATWSAGTRIELRLTAGATESKANLGTAAYKTAPSGDVVGTTDAQTLSAKTLTDPTITGAITEDVYTISDGAAFEIDPGNGTIQTITLGAARTPKATNFAAGESVTLMVLDGSAYTLTWTDATFGTSGVTWVGGTAPTLDTTNYTVIELWKVGSQVYGALVGVA